ncbi:MAG: type I restriction enzyme HsdR N-terminal domain-containing protein [Bacteroidaceae bacterium]|nr:type I restriction enzyme HsdR N-terminal domain-containing protein [Bacteroidaceae bacterium]
MEEQFKIRKNKNGKLQIFDPLRGKYVALTPEENVRQHFISFLTESLGYPRALMQNEVSIALNGLKKRCDTVVYSKSLVPLVIIEYKAPSVQITEKVFNQIARYNFALRVQYLIVSNGSESYCARMDNDFSNWVFLDHIPDYSTIIQQQL